MLKQQKMSSPDKFIKFPDRDIRRNYFPVKNEVMEMRLPWKNLAVYLYLVYRFQCRLGHRDDYPANIAEVFGIAKTTAKRILDQLFEDNFIYTVGPMIFPAHYIPDYEEEPRNFFPLPRELFSLGLNMGEVAMYAYLMYKEDREDYSCMVSRTDFRDVMEMSSNKVGDVVRTLEDKHFIHTSRTEVRRWDGKLRNGKLKFRVLMIESAKKRLVEMQLQNVHAQ